MQPRHDFHGSIAFRLMLSFVLVIFLSVIGFVVTHTLVHMAVDSHMLTLFIDLAINILIAWLVMSLFVYPKVIRRLQVLNGHIQKLAEADYSHAIDTKGTDEISSMGNDLENLRLNLIQKEQSSKDIELSREKLRVILDDTVDGIVLINERGLIESFNKSCESMFQYRADEMIGQNVSRLMPEPDRRDHDSYLRQYFQTGQKKMIGIAREVDAIKKDGTLFPVRLSVTEITVNNRRLFSGIIEDLEKRKKAEAEIAEAHKFQDLIMSNLPDMLFVKDEQFRIVMANPAFLNVYPEEMRDSVVGTTTLEKYDPKEAEEFLYFDRVALENGFSENEEVIQFPDGKTRALLTKKVRFENNLGQPFILGLARDITQIKATEDSLRKANAELEEFAYRTSHDLRSPLVSSISLLGMSKQALDDGDIDLATQSLGYVESSLGNLEHLVRSILTLTETQNLDEPTTEVDVGELISQAVEQLSHMEGFDRLSIQIDNQFQQPLAVKQSRLRLIIENLLSNSIKYQDRAEPQSYIKLSTQQRDNQFELRVEDNGLGIPADQQKHLFQMFKRFHSRVSYGSGLGLYMMKKSAEILQGTLTFEPNQPGGFAASAISAASTKNGTTEQSGGKGCVFKLSIPLNKESR